MLNAIWVSYDLAGTDPGAWHNRGRTDYWDRQNVASKSNVEGHPDSRGLTNRPSTGHTGTREASNHARDGRARDLRDTSSNSDRRVRRHQESRRETKRKPDRKSDALEGCHRTDQPLRGE